MFWRRFTAPWKANGSAGGVSVQQPSIWRCLRRSINRCRCVCCHDLLQRVASSYARESSQHPYPFEQRVRHICVHSQRFIFHYAYTQSVFLGGKGERTLFWCVLSPRALCSSRLPHHRLTHQHRRVGSGYRRLFLFGKGEGGG